MTSVTDDLRLGAEFPAATYDDWRKLVDGVLKGASFEKLVSKTYDNVKIAPIYARSLADIAPAQLLVPHVVCSDAAAATMTASIQHIRADRLRALAVTTATRSQALPDIPTVADFIPGYEASSWFGIAAPKDTPAAIVDALNRETNAGLADAKIMARPADFGKLIADETAKWAKVIKAAGIKPQ